MTDLFAAADLSAAKDALAKAYADFPPIGRCTPSQIDEAAAAVNQALHRVRIAEDRMSQERRDWEAMRG